MLTSLVAEFTQLGSIAVITMDHSPFNRLGVALRAALAGPTGRGRPLRSLLNKGE